MDGPSLPDPLSRPIASQRQFRDYARRIEAAVFTPPWRIVLRFYYLKKGELPDASDPDCYACAITYAQYHKVEIRIAPDHPSIKEEGTDLYRLLLHETFHSFFGSLNDLLLSTLPPDLRDNEGFTSLWDAVEDAAVDRLSAMPIFQRLEKVNANVQSG
jgi:hypothetical protein